MDVATLDQLTIVLDPIGQAGLAVALLLMMFGVALGLSTRDFVLLREKPVYFMAGVITQVLGLPLLTFVLITWLGPPPSIALGMIVVACCPGGVSSNLFTFLARGNVAYSVSLTAATSVLAALVTPVSIVFWSGLYAPTAELLRAVNVSPTVFLGQTFLVLAVPLAAGMFVAVRAPRLAGRLRRKMTMIGSLTLAAVIVYGLFYFRDILLPALPLLGGYAVLHNALALLLGYTTGLGLRAGAAERRALTFEIGIQNSGLAVLILLAQLKGQGGAAAIAALWGVWHLIAGAIMVVVFRYRARRHSHI